MTGTGFRLNVILFRNIIFIVVSFYNFIGFFHVNNCVIICFVIIVAYVTELECTPVFSISWVYKIMQYFVGLTWLESIHS